MEFVNVKNDIAFRKIFGNDNRKEVLISFLNAILCFEGDERVVSVTIVDPYQLPKLNNGKVTILDVKAKDKSGREFIVEMQVVDADSFDKRVLYYTSKSYSSQIKRGKEYRKLNAVFFIGILDFVQTKNPHYISRSQVLDVETGERTMKDLEFTFIELRKFKKTITELENLSDKWIYFIKNAENLNVVPENTNDAGLKSAYEEANIQTWTSLELDRYDKVEIRAQIDRDGKKKAICLALEVEIPKALAEQEIKSVLGLYDVGVEISKIAAALNIEESHIRQILKDHLKN